MPQEEPPRCLLEAGEAEVLGAPPVADPCPFLARVDAHLRARLGGSLGPLRRAVRAHPDAYWRLHYPGALDGFVPLDLAAVTEREVALGRARLLLDPRTQVLEALPPPGGPGSKARWQARVGTPERLVCAVDGARVEVRLDLEFTPPLAPGHLRRLLEGFLWQVGSAVRWAAGSDPGPLLRAEHGGTWEFAFARLSTPVFAALSGPSWRAVAEGRYRLEAVHHGDALELGFFPP
jgi:hypothetical protein